MFWKTFILYLSWLSLFLILENLKPETSLESFSWFFNCSWLNLEIILMGFFSSSLLSSKHLESILIHHHEAMKLASTKFCLNQYFKPYHGGNMMNAWRNAYAMHDINAFYRHKSLEYHLFLLTNMRASWFICSHHHSAPCMHLRRWHEPSDFPWQNDETMQRIIDDAIQIYMCESMWLIAQNRNHTRRTSMVMPSNNNTAETYTNMALQRYAWQMKETTRSVFAPCPYFGNLIGGTKSSLFSDNS